MVRLAGIEEKLIQAFKLSSFIHVERETAISIAMDATAKLDAAIAAQDKRLYYEAKSRNKVALSEEHLLQRLVYIESEPYERAKEQASNPATIDEKTLLVHFIKHLVRITLRRNSFYVTLGISRLLHNYSTRETMEIYNVVVQDPALVREDSYYRSRKGVLIKELKKRFGDLVSLYNGPHHEARFEVQADSSRYEDSIRACLNQFKPWFTPCVIPANFNPSEQELPELSFQSPDPDEEHKTELARMHAILDPDCYKRLIDGLRHCRMEKLSFDDPKQKLQIPRFNLSQNDDPGNGSHHDHEQPSELSEEELAVLCRELAEQADRRKQWGTGLLRILVDGVERARFDPRDAGGASFRIEESDELIEIYGQGKDAVTLLAVQLLSSDDESQEVLPTAFTLKLARGQELAFALTPEKDSEGALSYTLAEVTYRETHLMRSALQWARKLKSRLSEVWNQWRGDYEIAGVTNGASITLARRGVPALIGAASALLILGLGLGIWWVFFHQSLVDKGIVALKRSYNTYRPLEARITGFDYKPWVQIRDASEDKTDYRGQQLAENLLLRAVDESPSSAAFHALGQFYLAKKEYDKAIDQFEIAIIAAPNNAKLHSDLGTAFVAKAQAIFSGTKPNDQLKDFAMGLEHLNKAIELDDNLLEALFNRALCYPLLNLPQKAIKDWQRYLEKDPKSPWADEARRHLRSLDEKNKKSELLNERLWRSFSSAYQNRNDGEAYRIICQSRSRTGNVIIERLLDDYLALSTAGTDGDANSKLQMLLYAANLEANKADDRYTLDTALFYSRASYKQRLALVDARKLLRAGHELLPRSIDEALNLYRQARSIFLKAGDIGEAGFANLWIGKTLLRQIKLAEVEKILYPLTQIFKERQYLWLQSQALSKVADILDYHHRFSDSIVYSESSFSISERLGDVDGMIDTLINLAHNYHYLGDYYKSLNLLQRTFSLVDTYPVEPRTLWRIYGMAGFNLSALNLYLASRDFHQEQCRLAMNMEPQLPLIIAHSYCYLGRVQGRLHENEKAINHMTHALKIGEKMQNDRVGQDILAFASLQFGHLYRELGDFSNALASYDRNILLSQAMGMPFRRHEAHQGKFLALFAQGNHIAANEELHKALDLYERYRKEITEESTRNKFFDLNQDIFDNAIDMEYSILGNHAKAFDYSEISRARSLLDLLSNPAKTLNKKIGPDLIIERVTYPLKLASIQKRIPEHVQMVQYALLNKKLLIWTISSQDFKSVEQIISSDSLNDKVTQYLQSISRVTSSDHNMRQKTGKELYDLLIKPIKPFLDKDKYICIIPDKFLYHLPYGALMTSDSGKYLIEEYPIIVAPSSNMFIASSEIALTKKEENDEKLLSVGDPLFNRKRFPQLSRLSSAGVEASEITRYYRPTRLLLHGNATEENVRKDIKNSTVIHIAAHGIVDNDSPLSSKLILAQGTEDQSPGDSSDGMYQTSEIFKTSMPQARLVVLSACRSGVERYYKGEGMIGLQRPFLAAGVPAVVASIWAVDSEATAELMIRFHRNRKEKKLSTAKALQLAQLDLLNSPEMKFNEPYFWAGFSVFGGYTDF